MLSHNDSALLPRPACAGYPRVPERQRRDSLRQAPARRPPATAAAVTPAHLLGIQAGGAGGWVGANSQVRGMLSTFAGDSPEEGEKVGH